ncbi:MAG: MBL fold metallo-hydrolase, partial [Clostridia bacterium]|nr:MBL fold metallo-hydrolase [Clostridia bacterium]
GGLYGLKMQSEKSKMNPQATSEIIPGIYTIENDNFVNFYLIKNGEGYVAVDAGNSLESTRAEMDKLRIPPAKVEAVFLTHTDSDHVGALGLFKNARVYISSSEEQMINGKTARAIGLFKNSLKCKYEKVEDHQVIDISGLKVKGILNPGHTPGSMSYIVNDQYLFIGDAFSLKDQKAGIFNEFFNMDSETASKSIGKLAELNGVKYIFTGHYGHTDNFQRALSTHKPN